MRDLFEQFADWLEDSLGHIIVGFYAFVIVLALATGIANASDIEIPMTPREASRNQILNEINQSRGRDDWSYNPFMTQAQPIKRDTYEWTPQVFDPTHPQYKDPYVPGLNSGSGNYNPY